MSKVAVLFDSIIFIFLALAGVLTAVFIIKLIRSGSGKKLKTFRIAAIVFLSLAWLTVFYGSFIEPRLLLVTRAQINISKNPAEILRVALFSDLHVGPYKQDDYVEKAVSKILELKPDLILIAGDFVFDNGAQTKFLAPLNNLKAPLGVFAALGNHDYGENRQLNAKENEDRALTVINALKSLKINLLINKGLKLKKGKKEFILLGTDELWTNRADVNAALKAAGRKNADIPAVLLAHNTDLVWEAQKYNIDLMLAGHTHGGQIRLPFIGSVPKIPHKLGNSYDRGLFNFGNTKLFITSGAGEWGPRARLFVPPEIALLEIRI